MRISDWSSDVCSSDLTVERRIGSAESRDAQCRDLQRGRRLRRDRDAGRNRGAVPDRARQRGGKSRFRSEEHTSELQSLMRISYAVFCLKKKKRIQQIQNKSQTTQNIIYTYTIPT